MQIGHTIAVFLHRSKFAHGGRGGNHYLDAADEILSEQKPNRKITSMRILAISALALAAVATPAFAQDEAEDTFTGARVDAVAGWDNVGSDGESESGFLYGGSFGYDLQRGKAVFGVEGEVTGSTTEDCSAGACVTAGRDLYAGARVGVVAAPSTLIYAKGGYTNARAEIGGFGENFDGFRIGAGVEQSFGKFYGKIEYRYSNYELDLERHQVVAGLGVRF
jgi:outer membrane immunogenic protein